MKLNHVKLRMKVNALREVPYPSLRDTLPKYDMEAINAY